MLPKKGKVAKLAVFRMTKLFYQLHHSKKEIEYLNIKRLGYNSNNNSWRSQSYSLQKATSYILQLVKIFHCEFKLT